jgi:hypothetical protein
MSIRNVSQPHSDWNFSNAAATHASEIVLEVQKKPLKIKKGKVKDIARGLSEIAFSLGESNDLDDLSKEFEEDILEALKIVQNRQKKKKKK